MSEDQNFDEMSMEELESFISKSNEELDTSEEEQETVEETQEEVNEQPTQPVQVQTQNTPYDGKSAEELLKIVQDQQRFISQQGQNIGDFRKQLAELQAVKQEPVKQKNEYEDYDPDQIALVRKLAQEQFNKLQEDQVKQTQESINRAVQSNTNAYNQLKQDTELFKVVEPYLNEAYEKYGNSVLQQDGWVQSVVGLASRDIILKSRTTVNTNNDLAERKAKAQTVTGSSVSNSKAIKDMSEEEYLKHHGIKDLRNKRGTN